MKGPILIQGAMDVETDWLCAQLEDVRESVRGGFRFWRGRADGLGFVVSRTEIGTIAAASATTLGIEAFRPMVVINQGTAGSHSEQLHVGDIVIGRSCVHINDLKTPRQGRGEGSDPFQWEFHDHTDGAEPLIYEGDPAWCARFEKAPYPDGAKVSGRLGGGDLFSREYDRILWLRDRGGHLCEDMESIAAYQVCHRFGVPCVGLRIISNNELTGEPYQRETGLRLQRFIWEGLSK